jgi:branched-chain amino acid transport system substrate-binding protein
MSNGSSPRTNRRQFIRIAGTSGVGIATGLAGCSRSGTGDGTTEGGGGDGTTNGTMGNAGNDYPDKVVIGSNHPLSGPLAANGKRADNALKLAAKRANANGGVEAMGGAEVEVISGDNQGKQELGGQVTNELIDEGADVVTGCISSPVTMAATSAAERKQVPFVISIGSDKDILQGRGLNYAYRPQPYQRKQATNFAQMQPKMIRDAGGTVETAGLIYVNNSFGQETVSGLREELPKVDVEIVAEAGYGFGPSDLSTQVTKVKQADPDLVSITSYVPGGQLAMSAMKDQDYRPNHVACCTSTTFTNDEVLQQIGEFANGVTDTIITVDRTKDRTTDVANAFQSEYGNSLNMVAGMTYTTGEICIEAFAQAQSTKPDDVNQAIQNMTFSDHIMAMPEITFAKNGENPNAIAAVNQVQDLKPVTVYPEDYAVDPYQPTN